LPDTVIHVAVLVNPTPAHAKEVAAIDGIDCLQLHGAESPKFCRSLAEAQIPLWKAISMTGRAMALPDFHTNRLLLDTGLGPKFGGTGTSFPWSRARDLIVAKPGLEFILAGGLSPENVAEAVNQARPFGVDVASGVETRPGHKDIYRVRDFISAARLV
jgi:phosphoribosylanthranilate isomerase